ncbi:fungal-specific transcription factor domain-containing protein [Lipomyces kononenkoae]|uniref:Fungal-specific transcription factor domain-containing protein n=1 Tax=Lipomyces kononenkoae TaxID=34357 RepID=A0ACC3SSV6_LIPKO
MMLSAAINGYASTTAVPHLPCAEDSPSRQLPQLNDKHAFTTSASIQDSAVQTKVARQRISRACDQCNRFRTRCDGNQPCKRCSDHSLNCDYARQIKKRGKGSQRYTYKSLTRVTKHMNILQDEGLAGSRSSVSPTRKDSQLNGSESIVIARNNGSAQDNSTDESSDVNNVQYPLMDANSINSGHDNDRRRFAIVDVDLGSLSGSGSEGMDQTSPGSHQNDQYSPAMSSSELQAESLNMQHSTAMDNLSEILRPSLVDVSSSARTSQAMVGNDHFGIGNGADGATPRLHILSPYLESLSTAATSRASVQIQPLANSGCKYSILDPIIPSLEIISPSLAAHLLELYFTNTIYGIAHFVRMSSILRRDGTGRVCSKALLYSVLYVAAHASDHPVIIATPTSRTDVIRKLRDLIMENLQPLNHDDTQGTLDDVMTYIHLGIISSASEFKGSSLRWWHAAWGLARVLKLNVEVLKSKSGFGPAASHALGSLTMTEETREERRRVWWLLFMVDRHLALCYNRSISVMEHESRDVYQPCSDELWHSDAELISAEIDPSRVKGLSYRVTRSDIWGYFLPLMTLLGRIDDLHQLELSDILAASPDMIGPVRDDLRCKLDEFSQSIEELGDIGPLSILFKGNDSATNGFGGSATKRPMSLRTCWKEYCRCLIHVFHILLSGYWDPFDMLTVPAVVLNDEFVNVIQHSLDFAKCVKNILEVDHDLRLIPFFFGIYLLQGSFLLLYIVDVLLDRDVRAACETIVRAHEVCIVTLNTEYQRNFRQIMRSALQMIDGVEEFQRNPHVYDGSPPKDAFLTEIEENKLRRKTLLSSYRWSQSGNGLAV